MDIITELDLVNTTLGVTQVPGLHNASKAYLFQGKGTSSFARRGNLGGGSVRGVLMCCVLEDYLRSFSCVIVISMFRNAKSV